MATTTNYTFTLPTVGADDDAWGGYLNANWTKIDDILNNSNTLKIDLDNYTVDGITITNNDAGSNPVTINVETMTFEGEIIETVHALATSGTVTLDPTNGTIQTIAMTGNVTLSSSLASGEFITLRITSVGSDTVSFPTMEWIGGSAPVLSGTGTNWVHLWNVGGTLYGSFIGTSS